MSGNVSDLILKKGPLSPVWIAGTMKDKIGKKLVLATDIASVAKQIMEEEGVGLVLRLSGMLLKGLVVVYSKKTQYMLIDCEEVITKIMQSFKPGAVNLPTGGRRTADDALTVQIDKDGRATVEAIPNLDEWLEENPEARFVVPSGPIEFATPENSQVLTQLSDTSMESTASSQMPVSSDLGDTFVPPPPRRDAPAWEPVPDMPEWANIADDDGGMPMPEPENENESEDEGARETRQKIVDQRIELQGQGQRRRRARATAVLRRVALPQNEELENLFEIARQQFGMPPPVAESDSDGFAPIPYDDDIEIERNRDADPEDVTATSDDGMPEPRRVSVSASDIELEPGRPLMSGMSSFTGEKRNLQSPFPNYQFSIEATHKGSIHDSITNETIDAMNTIRRTMGERESITFAQVVAGASKHLIAKSFYQLMVVRSIGCVSIKQDEPFGPIEITRGRNYSTGSMS